MVVADAARDSTTAVLTPAVCGRMRDLWTTSGGDHRAVHDQLRSWAAGIYTTESTTDLLINARGGTFASPSQC